MRIYKFNKFGELTKSYDTPVLAALDLGITPSYVHRCIQVKCLVKYSYYLSHEKKIKYTAALGKRSNEPVELDINDLNRMTSYRDNLILSFPDFMPTDVQSEVIGITKLLCS
jgi:hypothetical protein